MEEVEGLGELFVMGVKDEAHGFQDAGHALRGARRARDKHQLHKAGR
jgi:hypothetical protein